MNIKTIMAACLAVLCVAIPGGQVFSAAKQAKELTINVSNYEQTRVIDDMANAINAAETEEEAAYYRRCFNEHIPAFRRTCSHCYNFRQGGQ